MKMNTIQWQDLELGDTITFAMSPFHKLKPFSLATQNNKRLQGQEGKKGRKETSIRRGKRPGLPCQS